MSLLVLNGSPTKKGTVASLPRAVTEGASDKHKVEWIDVYNLKMKPVWLHEVQVGQG
jgi:hypothetical protein